MQTYSSHPIFHQLVLALLFLLSVQPLLLLLGKQILLIFGSLLPLIFFSLQIGLPALLRLPLL